MNTTLSWFIPGLLLVTACGAHAHHGWSEYESAKALKFAGVIEESGDEHPRLLGFRDRSRRASSRGTW